MAFVNERLSDSSYTELGFQSLDRSVAPLFISGSHVKARDWTVDRERDLYLRAFSNQGKEFDDSLWPGWTFSWKGNLLWFSRRVVESGGTRNAPQWARSYIRHLQIPSHLAEHRTEILSDIVEAFQVYAGGGVFSTATNYKEEIVFES